MAHRYAVYYAAPADSPLELFGVTWLGRHHRTGEQVAQPEVPGMPPERLLALTVSPRRYGFHGTLKAPFRLRAERTVEDLHAAARTFAGQRCPFILPPLVIADLKGFLAFVPAVAAPALAALAADCVLDFEPLRAPLTAAEIARRPLERLSERQRRQLETVGYPYVFEDFAFHMTLTERLGDGDRDILLPYLQHLGQKLAAEPFLVDAIAIYEEPEPGAPFRLTARYGFENR